MSAPPMNSPATNTCRQGRGHRGRAVVRVPRKVQGSPCTGKVAEPHGRLRKGLKERRVGKPCAMRGEGLPSVRSTQVCRSRDASKAGG